MKLLVVGTVAFDAIETPFGKTDRILGGSASYVSLAASKLGTQVGIVSVVGGDFSQKYFDLFKSNNINIEGIEIKKNEKSFFWSGKYHNDMNSRDTLITELNVVAHFDPKVPENMKNSEVLLLGNLHPLIQLSVLEQMTKRPKMVILDTMNFWMNTAWNELIEVIKKIDVITINDSEARQLSKEYSLVKAAKKIQQMGPKYVVIKKGEHGALLFNDDKIFFAPALPLEDVFDPTGAGDTFAGGLAGYLVKKEDFSFESMKTAIIIGSALASITVEKFGTENLEKLTENELEERLDKFKELTTVTYL